VVLIRGVSREWKEIKISETHAALCRKRGMRHLVNGV